MEPVSFTQPLHFNLNFNSTTLGICSGKMGYDQDTPPQTVLQWEPSNFKIFGNDDNPPFFSSLRNSFKFTKVRKNLWNSNWNWASSVVYGGGSNGYPLKQPNSVYLKVGIYFKLVIKLMQMQLTSYTMRNTPMFGSDSLFRSTVLRRRQVWKKYRRKPL